MTTTPVRAIRLGPRSTTVEQRADGSQVLRSGIPLGDYPRRLTDRLVHWASVKGDQTFLAQRGPDGTWRTLSWAQTLQQIRSIGQALLERGLGPDRPIAVLSDNSLEHALLALAAQHVGVPYSPVSVAYSLVSTDHAKLKHILGLLTPGLVFAGSGQTFARAFAAAVPADTEIVVCTDPPAGRAVTLFDALLATPATAAVDAALERVGPDTVAKILFTSGSTGVPKGVTTTHRMLCSNQAMVSACLPCFEDTPPVLVDWLPWNHVFGGNHNLGIVLHNGGTLYIDEGKPVPALIERSIANLREIAPTAYYNVPRGFEALIPWLEREPALRKTFFSRLQFMFYAGASLSQPVRDALDRLALETVGERILMITSLGSTETAPLATSAHWETGTAGVIGIPAPGVEVKLVPSSGKLEARFRGPMITPGYWRTPELDGPAFDEEGFYRMGDALRFVDPERPVEGLIFDGRIAEDFKLATGTWVSVGPLRGRLIAEGAPVVQDVVITGHDRNAIGAMVLPNVPAMRALASDLPGDAPMSAVATHPAVRARMHALLAALAGAGTGSANRITRLLILEEPPSIDLNEVTDKGSINQRAMLQNRAALVESLYAEPPGPAVILAN
jgi:feruloyl-CoA synthase